MSKHSRFVLISAVLLFMLLTSLACPVTAFADDGTPPSPATEEPVGPATDGAVQPPIETPDVQEPAATEAPVEQANGVSPIADSNVVEETSEDPAAAEDSTVIKVLESVPEGTEVVVLNDEGSPEPLVTQAAVETVQNGDPRYTVLGTTYYFMPTGGCGTLLHCTESAAPIQTAIDYLSGMPGSPWPGTGATPDDGTIYVEAGTYAEDVFIVGNAAGWRPTSLTLRGAGSSTTTLDGGFNIINMNTFTLSGFTVADADSSGNPAYVIALGNTGAMTLSDLNVTNTGGNGITVDNHNGDITLRSVTSSNNTGNGAYLDNCVVDLVTGECMNSGNINVSSSTFGDGLVTGNSNNGIEVYSNGEVTLTNVIANGNANSGALLNSRGSVTVRQSDFNQNLIGMGLSVMSDDGSITLSGVTANGNLGDGGAALAGFFGSIDVSDSNFNENNAGGLTVFAGGATTLSNMHANGNGSIGAVLFNIPLPGLFGGDISVSNSTFNGNTSPMGGVGLLIVSFGNGNINLNTVSASGNLNGTGADVNGFSMVIQNSNFDGNDSDGAIVSGESVTIVCSQFDNNGDVGVDGIDVGTFTLNDVAFSGNAGEYLGTPIITNSGCIVLANSGGSKLSAGLPLHIVPVSGSEPVGLNCSAFSGTELVLPNGDRVVLYCPFIGEVVLTGQTQDQLQGQLGGQYGFLSAMNVIASLDEQIIKTVQPEMTVDFVIPADQQSANLAILHWDGGQWSELSGGLVTANGYFQAKTNYTGLFVLVRK